ncbi:MAG TPA: NIPSNAP family protein [Stellaceae bacterium]|nr:NIPSNAP family protein [Stellaceae bacterium]
MIVEQRTYTLFAGKTAEYLRLYESEGMAIQTRILGRLVGYFTTEIGPLNQIIHMWGYDSFEDRSRRRAQMQADPGWKAYVAKIQPLIQTQESKILNPTSFSPIK